MSISARYVTYFHDHFRNSVASREQTILFTRSEAYVLRKNKAQSGWNDLASLGRPDLSSNKPLEQTVGLTSNKARKRTFAASWEGQSFRGINSRANGRNTVGHAESILTCSCIFRCARRGDCSVCYDSVEWSRAIAMEIVQGIYTFWRTFARKQKRFHKLFYGQCTFGSKCGRNTCAFLRDLLYRHTASNLHVARKDLRNVFSWGRMISISCSPYQHNNNM